MRVTTVLRAPSKPFWKKPSGTKSLTTSTSPVTVSPGEKGARSIGWSAAKMT